jgi:hypothetical protein
MEVAGFGQRLVIARGLAPAARQAKRHDARPPRRLVDELLPRPHVWRADHVAALWGVGPLEAALALQLTTDEAVAEALARRIGATVTRLDETEPVIAADPAEWRQVLRRGAVGVDRAVGGKAILLAPSPADTEALAQDPARAAVGHWPLLVTTPVRFEALIRAWAEPHWVDEAVNRLADEEPERSAGDVRLMKRASATTFAALVALGLGLTAAPAGVALVVGGVVGLSVMLWTAARLVAACMPERPLPRRTLSDAELPTYTLLCPLHREERVAGLLLAALGRLDYPRAKLDIRLILEADDPGTLAAVRVAKDAPPFTVMVLPPCAPRTKPKALMMALPFVRGDLIAVYDAEDRPGRGQLREATETFAAADSRLGCLQAPLAIANADDTWLTRLFAAEYDGLFRVLLPAFARLGLPLPLGGTSNHFKAAALRQSLGWDPYNVTEDADLGFRLARNGWRVGTITTPTEEEAPPTFAGWLGQRSRWFKGWLQTLAVLAREPRQVGSELGATGLLALAATLAGSLGSALVHLVCVAAFAVAVWLNGWPGWAGVAMATFLVGYAGSAAYMAVGLARARRLRLAGWLVLLPLAWLAMGLAALRGAWQLGRQPFRWDKTQHGVSPAWLAGSVDSAEIAGEDRGGGEGVSPPALDARLSEVIALCERLVADDVHPPDAVAEALAAMRQRLVERGAEPAALGPLDAYLADIARRGLAMARA